MVIFHCPNCQTKMQAAEEYAGKTTVCPECNTATTIPAAKTPTAPTAITADPAVSAPTPAAAITTPDQVRPAKKPAANDDTDDDDRPRRRRDGGSADVGEAAAAGMGAGMLVLLIVGLGGCVVLAIIAILIALLVPAVQKVREAASRTTALNDMKQIVIACHNHHDVTKFLPTPKVFPQGPNGKASELSWRVAILPYVEQQNMWQQFNQNAAWDDPANSRFVQMRPMIYDNKTRPELKPTETHFQYFTGPNTLFPEPNRRVTLQAIGDGSAHTFLFAEVRDSVPWSKPADMAMTPNVPLPLPADRFLVAMADGSVRVVVRPNTSDPTLRLLINPNDGQALPADWDR